MASSGSILTCPAFDAYAKTFAALASPRSTAVRQSAIRTARAVALPAIKNAAHSRVKKAVHVYTHDGRDWINREPAPKGTVVVGVSPDSRMAAEAEDREFGLYEHTAEAWVRSTVQVHRRDIEKHWSAELTSLLKVRT